MVIGPDRVSRISSDDAPRAVQFGCRLPLPLDHMPVSFLVALSLLAPAVEASPPAEGSAEPVPVEAAEPAEPPPVPPTEAEGSTPVEAAAESPEPPSAATDPGAALEPVPQPEAPEPAPAPTTSPGPAPAPITAQPVPVDPEPSGPSLARPSRRGTLFGVSVGYIGCITNSCRDNISDVGGWRYRGGAVGQLEFGVRVGRIAPSVSFAMGGGPMKYTGGLEGIEGTMRFLDAGAGVMAFPMRKSRFDPYFGLRFGYARAREHLVVPGTDIEGDTIYSRFGLKLTAGLGFYVLPTLSIGPRFDLTVPVSGHVCSDIDQGEVSNEQCFDASSFTGTARRQLPRWFAFSVGMHFVLPRREARAKSRSR